MTLDTQDTIVAIASAPGGAARGIVRMSGPNVVNILTRSSRDPTAIEQTRTPSVFQYELNCESLRLPGDLYLWPTSRSYTRQPAAEFHTFGSPPLLQTALSTLCSQGARLARPGEFTLRAFLAGRLDLTQAEAVLGVIDAAGTQQLETALTQLAGGISQPLQETRNQLLDLCADLEAGLDFVDDDIEFVTSDQIVTRLTTAVELLKNIAADMDVRHVEQSRPAAVLVGAPNAGKSSLLNVLADDRLALVSETAGTTRDYVSGQIVLSSAGRGRHDDAHNNESEHGYSIECELFDTAGVESNAESGPSTTAQTMTTRQREQSRLTIYCIDGSTDDAASIARTSGGTPQTQSPQHPSPPKTRQLCVLTKCDLPLRCAVPDGAILTSAESGQGLDELKAAMLQFFQDDEGSSGDIVTATAVRCHASLQTALTSLGTARRLATDSAGDELVATEIRLALHQLGEIVGAIYTDDILDRVFSRFCIGK